MSCWSKFEIQSSDMGVKSELNGKGEIKSSAYNNNKYLKYFYLLTKIIGNNYLTILHLIIFLNIRFNLR